MPPLSTLAELRNMAKGQLDTIAKKDVIASILAANDNDVGALNRDELKITELQQSITTMRQEATTREKAYDDRINAMQMKMDRQSDVIMKQQMYLEGIDRKERENKLIVLGVPEDNEDLEGITGDDEKLAKIWEKIGESGSRISHKRLGNTATLGRKRPILVTIGSRGDRDAVLDKSKILKEKELVYKTIYIKKDVHPGVRKEWNRLREAERVEKESAGNSGDVIYLDTKQRKLFKNNTVIDSWTPHPF